MTTLVAPVIPFSLPEPEKLRRRWISFPKEQNECMQINIPMTSLADIKNGILFDGAVLADIAAYYQHFKLAPNKQHYYAFRVGDTCYVLTTFPTGHSHCTGAAQTLSKALSNNTRNPCCVFNDNFRTVGTQEEALNDMRVIYKAAEYVGITFNDATTELRFVKEYDFLGVHCNHIAKTIALTDKSVRKLKRIEESLTANYDALTFDDIRSILGFQIFASTVLEHQVTPYFHIFKFFRRRARTVVRPKQRVHPWKSIKLTWISWTRELLANTPININKVARRRSPCILYTDASQSGWGAVLFIDGRVYSYGNRWAENSRHINELEAWAVQNALNHFSQHLQLRDITLLVDNSSVHATLLKGRSKNYVLNQVAHWTHLFQQEFDATITVHWIPSEANEADGMSRLFQQLSSTCR